MIGVSASGEVVGTGTSTTDGAPKTLIWSSTAAAPTVFSASGYGPVTVVGVTDSGELVGGATPTGAGATWRPLVWSSSTATPSPLDLAGFAAASVTAVSSSGEIIGAGYTYSPATTTALVWTSATAAPSVVAPVGFDTIVLTSVSASGRLTGTGFPTGGSNAVTRLVVRVCCPGGPRRCEPDPRGGGVGSGGRRFRPLQGLLARRSGRRGGRARPLPRSQTSRLRPRRGRNVVGPGSDRGNRHRRHDRRHPGVLAYATVAPHVLAAPIDHPDVRVAGASSSGSIVGTGTDPSTGATVGLVWSSAVAVPTDSPRPAAPATRK